MKAITYIPLLIILTLLSGCQIFIHADGSKYRQLFPAKDKTSVENMDTARFVRKSFQGFVFNDTVSPNGHKTIVPINGTDLKSLINEESTHYIYFADPHCGATTSAIHKLDSLAKTGQKIIIVSLRKLYDRIDVLLKNTSFSKAPYYVIEDEKYSNKLLVKQIRVIKDLCESCYAQYRDDLAVVDYLVIGKEKVEVILYNDERNIMH